jgi:hypothetical protein
LVKSTFKKNAITLSEKPRFVAKKRRKRDSAPVRPTAAGATGTTRTSGSIRRASSRTRSQQRPRRERRPSWQRGQWAPLGQPVGAILEMAARSTRANRPARREASRARGCVRHGGRARGCASSLILGADLEQTLDEIARMGDIGKVWRVQLVTAPALGASSRIRIAIEARVGPAQTADY